MPTRAVASFFVDDDDSDTDGECLCVCASVRAMCASLPILPAGARRRLGMCVRDL